MDEARGIQFLAMLDDGSTALKISGAGNGGKLLLAFDNSQVPTVLKMVLYQQQLLRVTIEPVDD